MSAESQVTEILRSAGVEVGGDRPWDVQVHDERLYQRILAEGSLGAGEAYMDGWWDTERLDELFFRMLRARLDRRIRTSAVLAPALLSRLGNLQNRRRSRRVAEQHYDLSNRLYKAMLGPTMQYTCAYYGPDGSDATLDEAQRAKLALVAHKLHLEPGMRVRPGDSRRNLTRLAKASLGSRARRARDAAVPRPTGRAAHTRGSAAA